MQKFSHTIFIECSPQVTFDYLLDLRNDKSWWKQLKSTEKTSHGEVGEGSTFHQVSSVLFVSIHSDVILSDINSPQSFRMANNSPQLKYRVKYEVDPVDEGCNVTMNAEISAEGILDKLLPLTVKVTKRQLANNFKNLKTVLEERTELTPAPSSG